MISIRFYLFLMHLNLCFIGLHFFEIAADQGKLQVPLNFCKTNEFQCENGQCIAKPFICDGIPDCDDGSDETYYLCRNISCGEQYFQCGYGACINKEYLCDDRQQCSDGSDERKEECDIMTRKFTRTKRASSGSCAVPSISLDKIIHYHNCPSNCDPNSGSVPHMTVASVSCKPNFHPEEGVSELSICSEGIWKPPIANCYKRCDKLNPINVNLRCTRNGILIACDENSLLAGSKVRPTCRPLHRYVDAIAPDYIEMECNENGNWNRRLFQCVPECGRSYLDLYPTICEASQSRISLGVSERYGDSPWHVAIYNSNRILICGGTIIHPYIVLSAAHCFEENNSGAINNNTAEYEVVVSKATRNYTVKDNNCQRVHKIKEIRASPKGYFGSNSSFTADIVALILEEKITISSSVLPACVDWISLSQKTKLAEDTLGKVSGWGLNGTENQPHVFPSEQLLTANISFISRERCLRTVPDAFQPYVTFDKFCAGGEGGPIVLQGDSGGGFLIPQMTYQKETFHYLRGIVSLKDATITPIAAFTDLADHYEWIIATRNEIDTNITQLSGKISEGPSGENICNNYNVSNCVIVQNCAIAGVLILSKKAIFCGYDHNTETERICCKIPAIEQVLEVLSSRNETYKPVKQASVRTSAKIASSYCEKYSKYATDCVIDAPPPKGQEIDAVEKEYPHLARVAFFEGHYDFPVTLILIGTLISDQFVLSHAHSNLFLNPLSIQKVPSDSRKWIILGSVLSKTMYNHDKYDWSHAEEYDIEHSYMHPNYSFPNNAIVLHKMKTKVKFNSYIRPACLYTSNLDLINSEMRALGWEQEWFAWQDSPRYVKKSTITILDDQICSKYVADSKSMTCAGNISDYTAICHLRRGSTLQILKENTSCMWTLYAMQHEETCRSVGCATLGDNPSCGDPKPLGFTKISYHLDWIQSVVWPEG